MKRQTETVIGLLLLLAGCILNEWLLVRYFSPGGFVLPYKRCLIRLFDLTSIAGGLFLLLSRGRIRIHGKTIALVVLMGVVTFAALEVGLRGFFAIRNRLVLQKNDFSSQLGWKTTANYHFKGTVPGYGTVDYSTTNDGFRVFGDVNTSKIKILVLGDSSTQAFQVSDGNAYYDILRKGRDDIEIFAYGSGGYGSLQEFLMLDAFYDKIRPDIILWQFDGNDLVNNSFDLESKSHDNNLMTRPYLINGKIEWRYPVQSGHWATRLAQSSYVLRLLQVSGRASAQKFLVHQTELLLREDNPFFVEAVEVTAEIMRRVKVRADKTPIVAFCIRGQGLQASIYERICRELNMHFVPGVTEAVLKEETRGIAVSGMKDGQEVDSHFNSLGHEIMGRVLFEYLESNGLFSRR
jgi:hypothetical protein